MNIELSGTKAAKMGHSILAEAKVRLPFRPTIAGISIMIAIFCVTPKFTLADFHVSPKGKDTSAGTKRAPFATLERARCVRGLKQSSGLPDGGASKDFWHTRYSDVQRLI